MTESQKSHPDPKRFLTMYSNLESGFRGDAYAKDLLYTLLPATEKAYRQAEKAGLGTVLKTLVNLLLIKADADVQEKPAHADVLIWPTQFIHLDFLVPVYKELTSLGLTCFFICEREDMREALNNKGIDALKVNRKVKHGLSLANIRRFITVMSIFFKADRELRKALLAAMQYFVIYENYSLLAKKIFHSFKPIYNLLGYELSAVCRPILLESAKQGIRTGRVQQGALNYVLLPYGHADEVFVWDRFALEAFEKHGKNAVLTGPVNFKKPADIPRNPDLEEIRIKADQANQKICLIAFSGPGYNVSEKSHVLNIKILESIILQKPDILFLIKLHRKDQVYYYSELERHKNVLVHKNSKQHTGDFQQYLKIADFMLTGASTTALEAWQRGKIVIALDCLNELDHMEFIHSEMMYFCMDEKTLFGAFDSIATKDEIYHYKLALIRAYGSESEMIANKDPLTQIKERIGDYVKLKSKKQTGT